MAIRPPLKKSFRKVQLKDNNKKGEVVDHLSCQFTVRYEDGTFGFLFYRDEGVEWIRR